MLPTPLGLVDLPNEILRQILSYSVSHHVVTLWQCGNSRLIQRLVNGGAIEIGLMDKSAGSPSRWPCLLVELKHLRSLTINCGKQRLGSISSLRAQLKRLSATLEELDFDFQDSVAVLMEAGALEISPQNVVERSKSYSGVSGMWSLDAAFPRMRSLRLHGDSQIGFLRDVDFESLPRSLISLDIQATLDLTDSSDWQRLDLLPPTLERFLVSPLTDLWTDSAIARLPRSILELGPIDLPSDVSLQHLPPNLQSTASNLFPRLPQSLLSCECSTGRVGFLRNILPPKLTDLRLTLFKEVPAELIKSLPRTLRTLSISYDINWQDITSSDIFPPHLERLHLPYDCRVMVERLKWLPRTLASLTLLISAGEKIPPSFADLPPCLTHLDLRTTTESVLGSVGASLPRSLKSLYLATLSEGVNDLFDGLPLDLTLLYLKVSRKAAIEADLSKLSRLWRLRTLRLNGIALPAQFRLPHTLEFLDLNLPIESALMEPDDDAVACLPRSLTHLRLNLHRFQCKSLSCLPRTLLILEDLEIADIDVVNNPPVFLPPKLRILHCTTVNHQKELSADNVVNFVESLPPTLSFATFGDSDLLGPLLGSALRDRNKRLQGRRLENQ